MATITRAAWAKRFVNAYDLPYSDHRRIAIVAWESAEGSRAKFNPLATTLSMPGSTNFNKVGVKNYTSLDQGLDATRQTLQGSGHGYGAIVRAIKENASAHVILMAVANSDWGTGALALSLIDDVKTHWDFYAGQPIGQ